MVGARWDSILVQKVGEVVVGAARRRVDQDRLEVAEGVGSQQLEETLRLLLVSCDGELQIHPR